MVDWPLYFFCTDCGAIHELYYNDLHNQKWVEVMMYITETLDTDTRLILPKSKNLAKHFGFTHRQAQKYLKEYRELTYKLVKSRLSKEKRNE